jgi:F-type H+-transporting ATPase subunit alpha
MAELTLSAGDIAAAISKGLQGYTPSLEARTVGRVAEVGDGIARISGLPDCKVNELLEFEDGTVGLALNLEEVLIGSVVLGDSDAIEEGQTVKATGRILSVPVGDAMLGRVVNALGTPIDGKGDIVGAIMRRVEVQAPGIMGRKPVHEPLQTGIKSIDAMTPIGRGQRELIIGDRKTGKTTIAIDTIINQRGLGVKCIYVAIGQKGSTIASTVETLRQYGALEYTVIVAAPASEPAPFKYLAPYSGWKMVSMRSLFTMTCQSKQRRIARCHCFFAGHQAVRHTQETFSIFIVAFLSVLRNCLTKTALVHLLLCQ